MLAPVSENSKGLDDDIDEALDEHSDRPVEQRKAVFEGFYVRTVLDSAAKFGAVLRQVAHGCDAESDAPATRCLELADLVDAVARRAAGEPGLQALPAVIGGVVEIKKALGIGERRVPVVIDRLRRRWPGEHHRAGRCHSRTDSCWDAWCHRRVSTPQGDRGMDSALDASASPS